jgi:hemerythrin
MMHLPILHDELLVRDHRDILLYLMAMKSDPKDAYRDVQAFQQYLLAHSLREEGLMSRLDYPGLHHHLQCHGELLKLAKEFIPGLLIGADMDALRTKIDTMSALLIHHIQIEDGDFAAWKAEQESMLP